MENNKIRIGTRGSKLALWQAFHVSALLKNKGWNSEIEIIETKGDKILDTAISKIGSKGIFTQEIEDQLLNKSIDIAVHSAKDLQSELPHGLEIIAYSEREEVNDVLLSFDKNVSLRTKGLLVGTSSTRRVSTIKHFFPYLQTIDVRGNLQTRVKKLEEGHCDALILAYAGVHRMDYDHLVIEKLPIEIFTPAAGQGSIAIEASVYIDEAKKEAVRAAINHIPTEYCIVAERAFLKTMQGGCSIPVFTLAQIVDGELEVTGGIISLDGTKVVKEREFGKLENSMEVGKSLAQKVLDNGGAEILKTIREKIKT